MNYIAYVEIRLTTGESIKEIQVINEYLVDKCDKKATDCLFSGKLDLGNLHISVRPSLVAWVSIKCVEGRKNDVR